MLHRGVVYTEIQYQLVDFLLHDIPHFPDEFEVVSIETRSFVNTTCPYSLFEPWQHKPLSNLLFDSFLLHVNFTPCRGMSIKPSYCIQSAKSLMLKSHLNDPILSSADKTTLKSPIKRIGLLIAIAFCLISSNRPILDNLSFFP